MAVWNPIPHVESVRTDERTESHVTTKEKNLAYSIIVHLSFSKSVRKRVNDPQILISPSASPSISARELSLQNCRSPFQINAPCLNNVPDCPLTEDIQKSR